MSATTDTAIVTVAGDNDPPTTTDDSITMFEDTPRVLVVADFGTYGEAAGADDRGTLEVGKRADYTILSDNPWTAAPESWHAIAVHETRVGGEVTFSS